MKLKERSAINIFVIVIIEKILPKNRTRIHRFILRDNNQGIYSWMFKLSISDETIFCIETGKWLDLEEIIQEYSIPKDKIIEKKSKKKLIGIKKKIFKNYPIIIGSFWEFKIKTGFLDFLANSLIIIIGFYLLASTIAPLVNFANQTFRIIITIIGGIPSIFYYLKTYKEKTLELN